MLSIKTVTPFALLPVKKAIRNFEPMKFKVIVNNNFFVLGADIKQWGRFELARSVVLSFACHSGMDVGIQNTGTISVVNKKEFGERGVFEPQVWPFSHL